MYFEHHFKDGSGPIYLALQQPSTIVTCIPALGPWCKFPCSAIWRVLYCKGDVLVSPIDNDISTQITIEKSLPYWKWILRSLMEESVSIDSVRLLDYAILLPLVSDPDRVGEPLLPINYYTIITRQWNLGNIVNYI
jgi:hypothetical protein